MSVARKLSPDAVAAVVAGNGTPGNGEKAAAELDGRQAPGTTPGPVDVTEAGDDVVLTWAAHSVTITAARPRIRESSGAVRAELNVMLAGRHLHLADLALASTAARRTEVKALEEIERGVPWRDLLAHACRVLVEYARSGDGPAVELVPQMRTGERYAVRPVVLRSGATVLFGDGGVGKGWGTLTLSLATATGVTIAGLAPTRAGNVLYLDWEAEQADQQERLALLAAGLKLSARGIHYRRMSKSLPDAATEIRSDIHSIGNVQLVVVDSLMPASGGGDRAWHDVSTTVFSALRTFEPPQLIIAHLSRADAGRPGQGAKPFGSVFNMNFPRSVWEWRRAEGAPDEIVAGLYHIKSNNTVKSAPFGLRYTFEPNPEHPERVTVQRHDLAQEPELIGRAGLRDQLLAALRPGAQSVAALADALGKNEASIRKTLSRMSDKRIVVKLPDGTWGITA